ncbi:MAG: alpha/beta fold hydrolase [Spirochaetia bacterium]|nr:alpha/beta fold hydrolase [Spirochaetia bacterium]
MNKNILFHRKYPSGKTSIVILHGLFGSSQNWNAISSILANKYTVYALDLRNHGSSFHQENNSLDDICFDILQWLKFNNISDPILLGHSLGGLAAMQIALNNNDLIKALLVVDIAPKKYTIKHESEFQALMTEISAFESRKQIDSVLKKIIPDDIKRNFLMTNIERKDNQYVWRINVRNLFKEENRTNFNVSIGLSFNKPTLFVKGEKSNYILNEDYDTIKSYFPSANIQIIKSADHWVHFSAKEKFIQVLNNFLSLIDE